MMNVLLIPFLKLLLTATQLYMYVVVVHVIMSWLVNFNIINTNQPFVMMINNFLYAATELVLQKIRRLIPNLGGFDISPLVLILVLLFIGNMIAELAYSLRT
jgi:YGGT family.